LIYLNATDLRPAYPSSEYVISRAPMMFIVVLWFVLAIVIGVAAERRNRSGFGWFLDPFVALDCWHPASGFARFIHAVSFGGAAT
jgi:hypothetical protein